MVAWLPGATDFRWGQVKIGKIAPWTIASICSILNFIDCHNRKRMSVANRSSDKFWGQVPQFLAPVVTVGETEGAMDSTFF